MRGEPAFLEEGVIVGLMAAGLFQVELSNGHRCVGYMTRRDRSAADTAVVGDRVRIELTPYDLTKGRVRNIEKATA